MMNRILVVCIGNICRSPIAEVLLSKRLLERPEMTVHSAGLAALVDESAHPVAQELMRTRDIDISHHRARQLSSDLIFSSDLILTMTLQQQKQVESTYPAASGRVYRLGQWGGYDVPDPFQRPRLVFEQALALIDQGIDEWYRTLWA